MRKFLCGNNAEQKFNFRKNFCGKIKKIRFFFDFFINLKKISIFPPKFSANLFAEMLIFFPHFFRWKFSAVFRRIFPHSAFWVRPVDPQRHIGDLRGFYHFPDRSIYGVQSTRIAMVDNATLFRVFDEECYITRRLSELFLW